MSSAFLDATDGNGSHNNEINPEDEEQLDSSMGAAEPFIRASDNQTQTSDGWDWQLEPINDDDTSQKSDSLPNLLPRENLMCLLVVRDQLVTP